MTRTEGFWLLTDPDSATLAGWDDSVDLEQVLCPITKEHMRGGKRTTDLRVILRSSRIDDLVWTWHNDCVIQDRVLRRFREAGFSGFEVAPVEVTKIRVRRAADQAEAIRQLPALWEVIVTGWAGEAPAEVILWLLLAHYDIEEACLCLAGGTNEGWCMGRRS